MAQKERPVRLEDLRPGALVSQAPKKVCETKWTEDEITLVYADGTSYTGTYDEALYVLVQKPADDGPAPTDDDPADPADPAAPVDPAPVDPAPADPAA